MSAIDVEFDLLRQQRISESFLRERDTIPPTILNFLDQGDDQDSGTSINSIQGSENLYQMMVDLPSSAYTFTGVSSIIDALPSVAPIQCGYNASSHREWVENQEREQQIRDERAVQQFLAAKLKQAR
jgi:hypothetical protein